MAKRVWTFGVLLLLAGAVFLNRNLAQGQDTITEIDGLLLNGKEELEPCREFRKKAEQHKWKEADPESPSHLTKEDALEALALLETYPGTPPSHYKARQLYEQNLETFSSRVDQMSLVAKWGSLETECDMFFMFRHARLLLKDMSRFRFAPLERERVRTLIASYLKNERPVGSLLGVAIRAAILQALAEAEKNKSLSAEAAVFLAEIERRGDEVRKNYRERKAWELAFFSSYEAEIQATRTLDAEYGDLLRKARI
jgi:hypothetical protein